MPKEIRKKVIRWDKRYGKSSLEKAPAKKLKAFCKKHNLACHISREKMIENILLVQKGKAPKHFDVFKTRTDLKEGEHTLKTIHMQFALLYAIGNKKKSNVLWAKKFKVKTETIDSWLQRDDIRQLIEANQAEYKTQAFAFLDQGMVEAMQCLIRIICSNADPEIRRKACGDMLGMAGFKNVNVKGIEVKQSQGMATQVNTGKLTEGEERIFKETMNIYKEEEKKEE